MADQPDNLVLEILRRLQADLADLKEGQRATNVHLAAIESHMAGFHLTVSAHADDLISLKRRIERIERRLDLIDTPSPERRWPSVGWSAAYQSTGLASGADQKTAYCQASSG